MMISPKIAPRRNVGTFRVLEAPLTLWWLLLCIFLGRASVSATPSVCNSAPCHNGGECIDLSSTSGVKKFECACLEGYEGITCQKRINPCAAEPCENDGQCVPRIGANYHCVCTKGFHGKNCQMKKALDVCGSKPCDPNGACVPTNDGFICDCNEGYHGPRCKQKSKKEVEVVEKEVVLESKEPRAALIFLIVLVVLIILTLLLTSIHCLRVFNRISSLKAAQDRRRIAGEEGGVLPGWLETSNAMCADFLCCRGKHNHLNEVQGVIVSVDEYKSMMLNERGSAGSLVKKSSTELQVGPLEDIVTDNPPYNNDYSEGRDDPNQYAFYHDDTDQQLTQNGNNHHNHHNHQQHQHRTSSFPRSGSDPLPPPPPATPQQHSLDRRVSYPGGSVAYQHQHHHRESSSSSSGRQLHKKISGTGSGIVGSGRHSHSHSHRLSSASRNSNGGGGGGGDPPHRRMADTSSSTVFLTPGRSSYHHQQSDGNPHPHPAFPTSNDNDRGVYSSGHARASSGQYHDDSSSSYGRRSRALSGQGSNSNILKSNSFYDTDNYDNDDGTNPCRKLYYSSSPERCRSFVSDNERKSRRVCSPPSSCPPRHQLSREKFWHDFEEIRARCGLSTPPTARTTTTRCDNNKLYQQISGRYDDKSRAAILQPLACDRRRDRKRLLYSRGRTSRGDCNAYFTDSSDNNASRSKRKTHRVVKRKLLNREDNDDDDDDDDDDDNDTSDNHNSNNDTETELDNEEEDDYHTDDENNKTDDDNNENNLDTIRTYNKNLYNNNRNRHKPAPPSAQTQTRRASSRRRRESHNKEDDGYVSPGRLSESDAGGRARDPQSLHARLPNYKEFLHGIHHSSPTTPTYNNTTITNKQRRGKRAGDRRSVIELATDREGGCSKRKVSNTNKTNSREKQQQRSGKEHTAISSSSSSSSSTRNHHRSQGRRGSNESRRRDNISISDEEEEEVGEDEEEDQNEEEEDDEEGGNDNGRDEAQDEDNSIRGRYSITRQIVRQSKTPTPTIPINQKSHTTTKTTTTSSSSNNNLLESHRNPNDAIIVPAAGPGVFSAPSSSSPTTKSGGGGDKKTTMKRGEIQLAASRNTINNKALYYIQPQHHHQQQFSDRRRSGTPYAKSLPMPSSSKTDPNPKSASPKLRGILKNKHNRYFSSSSSSSASRHTTTNSNNNRLEDVTSYCYYKRGDRHKTNNRTYPYAYHQL